MAEDVISQAAQIILDGGLVAFPTETYYGLAADPFNRQALVRLFELKARDVYKPLLTLIEEKGQLDLLTPVIPDLFQPLMDFWPAPLTLVFEARSSLPVMLTGGSGTVGARISSHPLARQLVSAVGHPITATSANISGKPAATTEQEVAAFFGDRIDMILPGDDTRGGAPSTLVGYEQNCLCLIREGAFPWRQVMETVNEGEVDDLQWDRQFALDRAGGDEDLLAELVQLFYQTSIADLALMKEGIADDDLESAANAAHSIKGAAASLGVEAVRQLAYELEKNCRSGKSSGLKSLLIEMKTMLKLFIAG